MWSFTIGLIAEWIEEFRLFCMSFWSELYLLRNDFTTENLATFILNKTSQLWLSVKRQSIPVQLLLSFLVRLSEMKVTNKWTNVYNIPCTDFQQEPKIRTQTFLFLFLSLSLNFQVIFSLIVIVIRIYVKLTKGKCKSTARLDGCTVLVTGANNGEFLLIHFSKLNFKSIVEASIDFEKM